MQVIKALVLQKRSLQFQEPPLANVPSLLKFTYFKPCLTSKQSRVCSFSYQVTPRLFPPLHLSNTAPDLKAPICSLAASPTQRRNKSHRSTRLKRGWLRQLPFLPHKLSYRCINLEVSNTCMLSLLFRAKQANYMNYMPPHSGDCRKSGGELRKNQSSCTGGENLCSGAKFG